MVDVTISRGDLELLRYLRHPGNRQEFGRGTAVARVQVGNAPLTIPFLVYSHTDQRPQRVNSLSINVPYHASVGPADQRADMIINDQGQGRIFIVSTERLYTVHDGRVMEVASGLRDEYSLRGISPGTLITTGPGIPVQTPQGPRSSIPTLGDFALAQATFEAIRRSPEYAADLRSGGLDAARNQFTFVPSSDANPQQQNPQQQNPQQQNPQQQNPPPAPPRPRPFGPG